MESGPVAGAHYSGDPVSRIRFVLLPARVLRPERQGGFIMRICRKSLKELMDGGVLLDEPGVPQSTGATALMVRRSEISVKANIMKSPQIWCSIRGPSGATPKDMLLGLRRDVVGGQRETARLNELAAKEAPLRGGPFGFLKSREIG